MLHVRYYTYLLYDFFSVTTAIEIDDGNQNTEGTFQTKLQKAGCSRNFGDRFLIAKLGERKVTAC